MNFNFFQKYKNLFAQSLRMKIILLTCATTLATAIVIGSLNYFRTIEITLNKTMINLAGETRLASFRFKGKCDEIRSDAFTISRTPQINGVIHSINNLGYDSPDNAVIADWKKRSALLFLSIIKEHPHYRQISFIGIENNGRELVRVSNIDGNLEVADQKNLQEKSQESYFQEVLSRKDYDDVYVSKSIRATSADGRTILTVNVIMPIFYKGKLFGMLVINANYNKMFANAFKEMGLKKDAFIINEEGHYIEYHKDKGASDLKFYHQGDYPDFLNIFYSSMEDEVFHVKDNNVFYGVKFDVDKQDTARFLGVILEVPNREVMLEIYRVRNQNIILGAIVIIISLLLTILVTYRLTMSLKRMTKEVSSKKGKLSNLPIYLKDEIGELARAFKEKTEKLSASEEKIRTIMNNIIDGIIIFDKHGKIESYSDVCKNIFGYSEKEVLGKKIRFLLKKEAGESKKGKKLVEGGYELIGLNKDGSEFPIEAFTNKIILNDRNLFCCVVRNISERKQIENMKNEFISTVNHEIRTPLTSIQGSLSLLRIKIKDQLDEKNKKLLDISYNNCERLIFLVNDILDLEKIAAGKMAYNFEVVEICGIVKDVVARNEGYAQKYDVKFVVNQEIDSAYCKIDIIRFGQALSNLLANAAKFSNKNGEVTVTIKQHEKNQVKISVSDKGEGIPESFHQKIFQKFSQADSSSVRKKSGTGLGLNIAKTIIDALKGVIGFDSKEGAGTTFYIILPTSKK